MTVTTHDIGLESLDALSGVDSVCLFVAVDERPLTGTAGFIDWRLCGGLSRVLREQFFVGAVGDKLLLPTEGRLPMNRVFVIGVGKLSELTLDGLGHALAEAGAVLSKAKVEGVALELPGAGRLEDSARAAALANAFVPAFKGSRVAVLAEKPLRQVLPAK